MIYTVASIAAMFATSTRANEAFTADAPVEELTASFEGLEGPRISALNPDDVDPANFLSAEDIEHIARRRAQGLNIPDHYYDKCHFWINAVRARENLPALRRWREMESCTDDMAQYDHFEYASKQRPHAAFKDGYGCTVEKTGQRLLGQNSCPMWPNDWESIKRCTIRMWEEKVDPGVDPRTLKCNGPYEECGHYYTLRGGKTPSEYNKYDRVACGFYIHPSTKELYINQNFGNKGSDFLCGGEKSTHPPAFVHDCVTRENDYSDCAGVPGADDRYDEYGCDYRYCDPDYNGPCGDDYACSYLGVEYKQCQAGKFSSGGGAWTPFVEGCRETCKTCQCDKSLVNKPSLPAPTPWPVPAPVARPVPRPVAQPVARPVARPVPVDDGKRQDNNNQNRVVGPCSEIGANGKACEARQGCIWSWAKSFCEGAPGTCEGIGANGKLCESTRGCEWDWPLKHCVKTKSACEKIGNDGRTCERTQGCEWNWSTFSCADGAGAGGNNARVSCDGNLPTGLPAGNRASAKGVIRSACDCEDACVSRNAKAYAYAKKGGCFCFKTTKYDRQGNLVVKNSKKFRYSVL